MSTLYDEIISILGENDKSVEDIRFVSSQRMYEDEKFEIPIDLFLEKCKLIDPVATSDQIQIVGDDFWLEGDAEDGYFDFIEIPQRPKKMMSEPQLAKKLLEGDEETHELKVLGIMYEDYDPNE